MSTLKNKINQLKITKICKWSIYPRAAIRNPEMYAMSPGDFFVLVLTSHRQFGQIVWVEWGPKENFIIRLSCGE